MSTPRSSTPRGDVDGPNTPSDIPPPPNYAPPTYAAFSPANLSSAPSGATRRSTILVHQKSPLLLATPPQITRALAYSHPFLLPLNRFVGLLSWTTGDPWESFLLLVAFWAIVLYGDSVLRFAGPIVVVAGIIGGMYGRRYSPLSSSGWSESASTTNTSNNEKKSTKPGSADGEGGGGSAHQRNASEATSMKHQKTLDEIVDTIKVFTTRCNILLEPMLEMTDFLSIQRTATSATTRPALTTLFVRILAVTPVWIAMTLPPLRIITAGRVVLVFGTLVLTWHSKVARVSRTLLWRSACIRKLAGWVTGLHFEAPAAKTPAAEGKDAKVPNDTMTSKGAQDPAKVSSSALSEALKRSVRRKDSGAGVRFTFILYENQRRWLGLGWTGSLFAYERAAWTDEHNNAVPPKDQFELPEVEDGIAKWRWVKGSKWRVDGVPDLGTDEMEYDGEAGKKGWIYYDNKWQNGRRGGDGWGRWTRRRKWYRDAELVEVSPEGNKDDEIPSPSPPPPELPARPRPRPLATEKVVADTASLLSTSNPETASIASTETAENSKSKTTGEEDDAVSVLSTSSKSAAGRFRSGIMASPLRRRTTDGSSHSVAAKGGNRSRRTSSGAASLRSNHDDDSGGGNHGLAPNLELEIQGHARERDSWGIGDEALMGLE